MDVNSFVNLTLYCNKNGTELENLSNFISLKVIIQILSVRLNIATSEYFHLKTLLNIIFLYR